MKDNNNSVDAVRPNDERPSFWKAVWLIIRGKGSDNGGFTMALLSGVLSAGFNILFSLGLLGVVLTICATIQMVAQMTWEFANIFSNVSTLVFIALVCVLLFLLSVLFRGAANDLKSEKDRNYIVALFSGLTSFAALIVALVALIKG